MTFPFIKKTAGWGFFAVITGTLGKNGVKGQA
jgi:hypothetical protein